MTVNHWVAGSSPARGANPIKTLHPILNVSLNSFARLLRH
jgi:hypothetical protein